MIDFVAKSTKLTSVFFTIHSKTLMELWEELASITDVDVYSVIVDEELMQQDLQSKQRKIVEFTQSFKLVNGKPPSCMNTLQYLMETYPTLVYFGPPDHQGLRIFFHREKLLKNIDPVHRHNSLRHINFCAFERGLKHAGLKVLETTSDTNEIKKWGIDWMFGKKEEKKKKDKNGYRKRVREDAEDWRPTKADFNKSILFCHETKL